jgi:hypothetical protein
MAITPVLTQQVIKLLYTALGDIAKQSNLFDRVDDHESRNPPGRGLTALVLMGGFEPVGRGSGLQSTTGRLEFTVRIAGPRMAAPDGKTDQAVLYAAAFLMAAFNADLDLDEVVPDGLVRCVDVLGMYGSALRMQPGWITDSEGQYRVAELTVPLILNDVFPQGA